MIKRKAIRYVTKGRVQLVRETTDLETAVLSRPEDTAKFLFRWKAWDLETVESFGVITLSTRNRTIGVHEVTRGVLNGSLVHPREIYMRAILDNAAAIIAFHNHPSGDEKPSREDQDLTKRLLDSGKVLGIDLLDHVILGHKERFYSFRLARNVF